MRYLRAGLPLVAHGERALVEGEQRHREGGTAAGPQLGTTYAAIATPAASATQENDPAKRKALATEMQLRVLDQAPQMFLGQFAPPTAYRANLNGVLRTGVHTFWNISRDGS